MRHETAHHTHFPASRMHHARRDLVSQTPFCTMQTTGTFALRSPVWPNPIASSIVELLAIDGATLQVRGLDCLNGTPLIDLKPERVAGERLSAEPASRRRKKGVARGVRLLFEAGFDLMHAGQSIRGGVVY